MPKRLPMIVLGLATLGVGIVLAVWHLRHYPQVSDAVQAQRDAEEALERQDFEGAARALRRCLEHWPAHGPTHLRLARACRRSEDPAGWQSHLRIAEALQSPAEAIAQERVLMRAQMGEIAAAREAHARLGSEDADDELIFEALIKGALEAYRLAEAAHWATQWIARNPVRWQPWLFRGRSHYLNEAFGNAIADYRKALSVRPDHRQSRQWLGGALLMHGQFSEALPLFESLTQDYPNDKAALLGLANSLIELGRGEEAEAVLDRLLTHDPKHVAGLLLRGRLDMSRDASEKALVWLRRAETVAPLENDVINGLAQACRQSQRLEEAQKYQKKADELRNLAIQLDKARRQIIRAPGEVAPRYEAGQLTLRLGRPAEALEWLQGALAVDPEHKPTHEAMARCFDQLGDPARAEYHRQSSGSKSLP